MSGKSPEPVRSQCDDRQATKLKVKRPFNWTARKSYRKGDAFDLSKCSKAQLERVGVMRDSGGFFESR